MKITKRADQCPLVAPLRHPAMSAPWSLTGGKRTSHGQPISVEIDPTETSSLTRLEADWVPFPTTSRPQSANLSHCARRTHEALGKPQARFQGDLPARVRIAAPPFCCLRGSNSFNSKSRRASSSYGAGAGTGLRRNRIGRRGDQINKRFTTDCFRTL